MNKLLTITCCCLLISGCTLRKDYTRPEIETTGLFGRGAEESAESLASLPWRDLFADPCLQSLISKGLMNNSDLAAARLRLQQAQATLMTSRRAFLPSLSLPPRRRPTGIRMPPPAIPGHWRRRPRGRRTFLPALPTVRNRLPQPWNREKPTSRRYRPR